jgi:hypothetical protein
MKSAMFGGTARPSKKIFEGRKKRQTNNNKSRSKEKVSRLD